MVQIIPRAQKQPSFGERFAQAVGGASRSLAEDIPSHMQGQQDKRKKQMQMMQENAAALKMGVDLSGFRDPKDRQMILQKHLESQAKKQEGIRGHQFDSQLQHEKYGFETKLAESELANKSKVAAEKLSGKSQEKLAPFQSGLQTIEEMRKIGSRGKLGRGSAIKGFLGGETAKDRAQYEQLGKSLISLASNIPIRNQREFETLAHNLYDPSLPDSAREGILDAMESIISRSMQQFQGVSDQGTNMGSAKKEKPPLSSFHR